MSTKEMRVSWSAPHAWPKFETVTGLPPLPRRPGVYLWTFEYRDGYLIYLAGEMRQLFRNQHRQHRDKYMAGRYSIFDLVRAKNGVRSEAWHGLRQSQLAGTSQQSCSASRDSSRRVCRHTGYSAEKS